MDLDAGQRNHHISSFLFPISYFIVPPRQSSERREPLWRMAPALGSGRNYRPRKRFLRSPFTRRVESPEHSGSRRSSDRGDYASAAMICAQRLFICSVYQRAPMICAQRCSERTDLHAHRSPESTRPNMNDHSTTTPQPKRPTPTSMRPVSEPAPSQRQVRPIPMGPRAARERAHVPAEQQQAPQQIDLRIDELVLHGFSRSDQARISEAIQVELRRLLGERRFTGDIDIARLDGGSFTARRGMRPEQVGIEVARAIMKGMR